MTLFTNLLKQVYIYILLSVLLVIKWVLIESECRHLMEIIKNIIAQSNRVDAPPQPQITKAEQPEPHD